MSYPMSESAVALTNVLRTFGRIRAVNGLNLEVPAGTVTVLLGPNGAGKTTTVRLITGALNVHGGDIHVLGLDPAVNGDEIRRRTGVVPPKPALYDQLTGYENLAYTADIWRVSHKRIPEAAERFGISYALADDVAGYSTGMRTRLALARAVIHDPEILLLDEPTAGLDPESSRAVLDLIRELAGRGRTIVMCTHLLHEAEGIADQVVLMGAGSARAAGPPMRLAAEFMKHPRVIFDAENRRLLKGIEDRPGVLSTEWNGALHVTLETLDDLPDLVGELVTSGTRLTRVEPVLPTLEHLYFEMQKVLRKESE